MMTAEHVVFCLSIIVFAFAVLQIEKYPKNVVPAVICSKRSVLFSEVVTSPNTFQSPAMSLIWNIPRHKVNLVPAHFHLVSCGNVELEKDTALKSGDGRVVLQSQKRLRNYLENIWSPFTVWNLISFLFVQRVSQTHHTLGDTMTQWSESSFLYQSVLLL